MTAQTRSGCTELTCPQHGEENRLHASLVRGLEQSAAGEVFDLGSFAQYADAGEAAQSLADAGVDFRSSETLRGPEASLMEVSEALRGMSHPLAPARGVMWGLLFAAIFWVPALAFVIGKMP